VAFATPDLTSDSDTSPGKAVHYLPDYSVKHARIGACLNNLNWTSTETHNVNYNDLATS